MRIRVPRFLARALDAFRDWGDVPVAEHSILTIRRIDCLLAAAFTFCVGYYWLTSGWLGALAGGLMFLFMALIASWV